jgi:hypothetical protein
MRSILPVQYYLMFFGIKNILYYQRKLMYTVCIYAQILYTTNLMILGGSHYLEKVEFIYMIPRSIGTQYITPRVFFYTPRVNIL